MSSGASPHPGAGMLGGAEVVAARGTLRDAVGALQNLDRIARSIRVGPRAVGSLVPDVHAACSPMREAILLVTSALETGEHRRATCKDLRSYVLPRLAKLESELAAAMGKTMNARSRLRLEQVVSQLLPELEATRELLELLVSSGSGKEVHVGLGELLAEALKATEATADGALQRMARVSVPAVAEDIILLQNPHAAQRLLRQAASLVASEMGSPVRTLLVSTRIEGDSVCASLSPWRKEGKFHELALEHVIAPTEACLQAAAADLGVILSAPDASRARSICWQRG